MRRALTVIVAAMALVMAMTGSAIANNPPSDPLPVNGEPHCFGARVSHSAADHGLTPKAKVILTQELLPLLGDVFPPWAEYYEEHGVSVRTVQDWIRINCSDDPIIPNP